MSSNADFDHLREEANSYYGINLSIISDLGEQSLLAYVLTRLATIK